MNFWNLSLKMSAEEEKVGLFIYIHVDLFSFIMTPTHLSSKFNKQAFLDKYNNILCMKFDFVKKVIFIIKLLKSKV